MCLACNEHQEKLITMTPPSEEIITKNEEYEELGRKEVKEAVTALSLEAFMFLDVLCL